MINPRQSDSNEGVGSNPAPPASITLHLSPDLAAALHRYSQQSGQSPAAAITGLLRSALQLTPSTSVPPALIEEVQRLQDRLSQLEELIPKVEALEGKWLAF
ncbi:MAG: hypothetical protein IGS50_14185 [Synechococcales cyanobacterium C42_A2020_086]|jgi:hypothetical protein|nr:hypothetical protein [Synechococcales cyanobacterium C42_A2020_086]